MSSSQIGGPRTAETIMTNCPKCGFHQPADQYCANCGVDMAAIPKKAPSAFAKLWKHPILLAAIGVVSIAAAIGLAKSLRPKQNLQDTATSIASGGTARSQNMNGSEAKSAGESLPPNSTYTATSADYQPVTDAEKSAEKPAINSSDSIPAESTAATAASPGLVAGPGATQPNPGSAPPAGGTPSDAVMVAFAWAEASREWLQAIGSAEPGIHRVADLDARLRETPAGYRIGESVRHKLSEKTEPISLSRGDRFHVRFETTAAGESSVTGNLVVRVADGSGRPSSTVPITIDKGQGAVLNLGAPPPTPQSAASPGGTPDVVVFILPRWTSERNP